jgi:outer membrane protein assembly factor BamA
MAQREIEEEGKLPFIPTKDSSVVVEMDLKNFKILPFAAPSVSPEVGFMLIGGGLISFKVDKDSKFLQRSSVPFSFGYSTNESANMNIRPALFFKNDKNRISGDVWMKDMPDNYWGVGYDAARKPSKPDSTTKYTRNWWQLYLKYVHQFKKNFFAGVLLDYNQTKATKLSQQMQEDFYIRKDGTFIRNWSLGLLFQYDSRDITVNAYEGLFLELSSNFYRSKGFEKPYYQIIVLDYRQYKQIQRPGRTLAWQVKTRVGIDDVPWPEMSQLGTPFDLRGYRWGRYRDRSSLLGMLEYRHMFMRKTPAKDGSMMSRFGIVGWLASGSVASSFPSFSNWLPNAGVGLRFEVQKRMNARFDFGIGDDTSAFYISFNEAF